MKNIYTLLTALCLGSFAMAQDAFWTPTTYRGAFPVTDNTPATDWTSGWANFDPENTVYPATVTTVSADITTNTTWSGVVKLMNKVYVKNNATLTIAPGTIIRGDKLTQGTLLITRGAKIIADGTAANPIIFTSNEAVGARNEGDWGGLVLLGLAKNNQPGGVANIEGIVPTTDSQFGGNFDNDYSGILRYVRVEFAGIPLEPNKEINGITFGSVGNQTIVDYVQVSFSGDDSFEWFGGTVNCKHLIAYRGIDDDFDTDFGYRGKIQFFLSIRDKDMSDAAGDSNCFESDNDATGSAAQPKTMPIFSNGTIIGPRGNGTVTLPIGEKFEKAFRLRRNTSTSVLNSLVTGWEKGLSIEGTPVVNNVNGDSLVFAHNSLTNFNPNTYTIYNAGTSGGAASTAAFYLSFMGPDGNDTTQTLAQINWVNAFTALGTTPDARLAAGSTAATNGKFFVITEGLLDGLNTSTASAGDAVWLGTNGNLIFGLANKPVAPAHLVYIGVVTRSNANNGEIFVNIQNGFEFNELHDVLINGVSAGQLIRRDSDGLWKNWTPNYITASSVDTLLNKTIELGTGIATIVAVDSIDGLIGQVDIPMYQFGIDKGGTMRLGAWDCSLAKGSLAEKAYGTDSISERHRHRYEFNNDFSDQIFDEHFVVTGTNLETGLVEIIEYNNHPWFVGVQFHPEYKSTVSKPHPLFLAFIKASLAKKGEV